MPKLFDSPLKIAKFICVFAVLILMTNTAVLSHKQLRPPGETTAGRLAADAADADDYDNFDSRDLTPRKTDANGAENSENLCPKNCFCDERNSLKCENIDLTQIPSPTVAAEWSPNRFETILIRNCTLVTIEKNAFRRFANLREIHIRQMPNLDLIDKYAFKGLSKLRLIEIAKNPKLRELYKASFSGIGNKNSMRIRIVGNGLQRVRALAFKSATNLRELTVEDKCFTVESHAFAAIQIVDFLTIRGACFIDENAFQNTSRVHSLSVTDSTFDLKHKTFAHLHHVNQIHLRENRIDKIEEDAFAGLFTVGAAHLQSNRVGRVQPRAFANAENLGSLVLSYNTIAEALESPECLTNGAQKFVFTENTLHCACEMRWIQFHQNSALLAENYCGREEAFKALVHYKPLGCPPLHPDGEANGQAASSNEYLAEEIRHDHDGSNKHIIASRQNSPTDAMPSEGQYIEFTAPDDERGQPPFDEQANTSHGAEMGKVAEFGSRLLAAIGAKSAADSNFRSISSRWLAVSTTFISLLSCTEYWNKLMCNNLINTII